MADIAMCLPLLCPLKNKCYRYTAPVGPSHQAYAAWEDAGDTDRCFWDNADMPNYAPETPTEDNDDRSTS